MDILLLIVRCTLSTVLLVAGAAKLLDQAGLQQALRELGLQGTVPGLIGRVLPAVELMTGVSLLSTRTVGAGAWAAAALFGLFSLGVGFLYLRGRTTECRCFGSLSGAPIGVVAVVRNVMFTGLALLLVGQGSPARASLFSWLAPSAVGEPLAWTSGLLTLLVVVVLGLALARLFARSAREVANPPQHVEQAAPNRTRME